MSRSAVLVLSVAAATAIDNGLGRTPPMGWRSWNCYGGGVDQGKMTQTMDRMSARTRTVDGELASLLDLGYNNVGLDDNWQLCGTLDGQRAFHAEDGTPLVNTKLFPSLSEMTAHGHARGLRVGWYMNNCICAERGFSDPALIKRIMEKSAAAVAEYEFDGLKLDSCSQFNNLTWWASLLNATGRHILIENCHQGGLDPPGRGNPGQGDEGTCLGTTTPSDCPYNLYRTSGDINPNFVSAHLAPIWPLSAAVQAHVMGNVNTVVKFLGSETQAPLSRPGSWAYPDMMEVGNLASYAEDEAHFGLWVVTSSPLILGFDMTSDDKMSRVWPIITNREAIAINQEWAGSPGQLLMSRDASQHPDSLGFLNYTGALQAGNDLKVDNQTTVEAAEAWCAAHEQCQGITFDNNASQKLRRVYFKSGITLNGDRAWSSLVKKTHAPPGPETQQIWIKRLRAAVAVLFVNAAPSNTTTDFSISLQDLGINEPHCSVRDIWKRTDLPPINAGGNLTVTAVAGHSSRFLKLTPSTSRVGPAVLPLAGAEPVVRFSPESVAPGDWVTVRWSGIPPEELARNTSEYICTQDSHCEQAQHLSAWVGVFAASSDLTPIGPQAWPCANPPWLASSPIKWKPITQQSGSTKFRLEAVRQPLIFALFSNGTSYPIHLTSSAPTQVRSPNAPRHLHLALTGSHSEMRVQFESFLLTAEAVVRWGPRAGQYTGNASATPASYSKEDLCGPPATSHGWWDTPWFYNAVINGLAPGSTVYYVVGSHSMGWSMEHSFSAPIPPSATAKLRVTVLADVGESYTDGAQYHWMEPFAIDTYTGAVHPWGCPGSVPVALSPRDGEVHTGKSSPPGAHTLARLAAASPATESDVVVHIGDLAYATGYETEWDFFMSQIEPLASSTPYMIGQGNHERDYPGSGNAIGGSDSGGECGIPTQARFRMPTPSHRQDAGWFSFEQGPVHFLMMDTEMSAAAGSAQLSFIQKDLQAVQRSLTPWVIVMGHRPMYSSTSNASGYDLADGSWWPDVENVLVQHEVDLCLWGHVHNAEVTCPLINGSCVVPAAGGYGAPIHAVVGNGGQSLTKFPTEPYPVGYPPAWSRWRFDSFGYSSIEVSGAESLTMRFFADAPPSRPNELVYMLNISRGA